MTISTYPRCNRSTSCAVSMYISWSRWMSLPNTHHSNSRRVMPILVLSHVFFYQKIRDIVRGNGNPDFPNHRARLMGRRHAANPSPLTTRTQVCVYASPTYQRYVTTPSSHHRPNQSPCRPWYRRQSHHSVGKLGCRTDATQLPKRRRPHVHILRWVCLCLFQICRA
jgi:hypothetical protein